jgi:hypothetical protein
MAARSEPEDDEVIHKGVQDTSACSTPKTAGWEPVPCPKARPLSLEMGGGGFTATSSTTSKTLCRSPACCFDFQGVNNRQYADRT